MRSIALRFLALLSTAATFALSVSASTAPRYGGALRIELSVASLPLDPREWRPGAPETASAEKIAALVCDRLVAVDSYGRVQPQLVTDWTHDSAFRRWQLTLRSNVKFTDGSNLAPADVVSALQSLLPATYQITVLGNTVVIQTSFPAPDLLEELASGPYFVCRSSKAGTLIGTGPFAFEDSPKSPATAAEAGITRFVLRANEEYWAGRPYLDTIELKIGVPPLRALLDLQLKRADLIELSPDLVRRATDASQRVWSSAPLTLVGLRFETAKSQGYDATLRQALSASLDRGTMASVLLQKQAEPAAALLPQWLSGYAFLFDVETNLTHAKQLREELPASAASASDPLRLRVDAPGELAKLLGERVVVNARQSSLILRIETSRAAAREVSASTTPRLDGDSRANLHLFIWHYTSLSPRAELAALSSVVNSADFVSDTGMPSEPDQLYARERRVLEEHAILPLVLLPEYVGLAGRVRNWMPSRWADWHLADVWLDSAELNGKPLSPRDSDLAHPASGARP